MRALVLHFKRKRTWRSWHHDMESIRHDLESLCSDNDPRCHMRKIKMTSSDWIALLRRLLISNKHLGEVHRNVTKCTSPNHLLLSNQDKGSTPSLAHSLALPHDPGLLNVSIEQRRKHIQL